MTTVLSFIDWYWPGFKAGGTTKAFRNMVSSLNEQMCFYIVTRNTDYTEETPYEGLDHDTWNKVGKNVYVWYASPGGSNIRTWMKIIRTTPHDTLYIHGVFSFWYSLLPLILGRLAGRSKLVVAAHGMLGNHALAVKSFKKRL